MATSRRWKRLFLLGTGTTTLAVILWATYLFTAIWLRVRCVRELAEQAESLPEVAVRDQVQSGESKGSNHLLFANVLWDVVSRSHRSLERLESLQQPNIATVLRHLLGRGGDETSSDLQRVQSLAFSPQGQVLATSGSSTATVQIWNHETGAPQTGSFSLNVTSSPGAVSSGQALARIAFWEPAADFQCYSATDSHGEKVLIVTRALPQEADDEQATESPPPREVLLIDTAGRIFARRPCPGDGLVGKLAEPQGKADQLVFGTLAYEWAHGGTITMRFASPGAVCIIEDGQLKTVRAITVPSAPNGKIRATETTETDSVEEMKQ